MYRKTDASLWLCIFLLTSVMLTDAVSGTSVVKPSLRVEESYDSNADLGSRDRKEDFITSIVPTIDLVNERKGLTLRGSYSLISRHYSREPELNYISHVGNIEAKMDVSERSSISLSDSVSYTKDSREADGIGIQTTRTGILSNTAAIALSYRLTQLTSLTLRGSDSFSKFDDSDFIDSRTDSAGIDLVRQLNPFRSVNASYTYTNFHFEDRGRDDVNSHSFQLGISEQFSPDLSLNLSGGMVYLGEIGDKYDWTAQAGLSKKFEMSAMTLAYSRGVTTSSGLTDEINISDRGTLTWTQTLARTLNMALSGSYAENHTEPTSTVRIKSYDASIRTDWRPDSWITVGAGYSRFQQWVDGPVGTDLSRDQVFVSVTVSSDGWRF